MLGTGNKVTVFKLLALLGAVINPLQRGPGFRNLKRIKCLDRCLVPTAAPEWQLVLFTVLIIATRGEDSAVSPLYRGRN